MKVDASERKKELVALLQFEEKGWDPPAKLDGFHQVFGIAGHIDADATGTISFGSLNPPGAQDDKVGRTIRGKIVQRPMFQGRKVGNCGRGDGPTGYNGNRFGTHELGGQFGKLFLIDRRPTNMFSHLKGRGILLGYQGIGSPIIASQVGMVTFEFASVVGTNQSKATIGHLKEPCTQNVIGGQVVGFESPARIGAP